MINPLFSILIANYNNGRYLQDAIDSVLAQTYSNWEVVIVDDKSSDNSYKLYARYIDDSRFRIFYNEKNEGCGYTKRRCVEMANGDICGFLDPDDKLAPEALMKMVEAHQDLPDYSLVYSTHYRWDDYLELLSIEESVGPMLPGEDFLISSRNNVSHFATFKKSFYCKTTGINAVLKSAVDVDEYFLLEEVGKLYYIDYPLYYYRLTNPNSISIASPEAKSLAFLNRMFVSLNAFSRRIKSQHPLFVCNKERYLYRMRWQMGVYKRDIGKTNKYILKYCWWYWVGADYSFKALNHIRKIIFM